jgi:hypothetical protein
MITLNVKKHGHFAYWDCMCFAASRRLGLRFAYPPCKTDAYRMNVMQIKNKNNFHNRVVWKLQFPRQLTLKNAVLSTLRFAGS